MLLLDVCDNGDILKVFRVIRIGLEIIRVVVPILIIITVTISATKVITSGSSDSFKEFISTSLKKIVAGLLVFLAPNIINVVLGIASNDVNNVQNCFKNATLEGIERAYEKRARNLMDKALNSYDEQAYMDAKAAIAKIGDINIRKRFLKELDDIKYILDVKKDLASLNGGYSDDLYKVLKAKIAGIGNSKIRSELDKELEEIKKLREFKAEPGILDGSYTANGVEVKYHLYIPNNAKAHMPLIIYLHGDGHVGRYDALKQGGIWWYVKKNYGEDYPFIYLQPYTPIASWTDGSRPDAVVQLIKKICTEYKCNSSKIILTGSSRGGMGAWFIANKYSSMFSAFVPVVGTGNINPGNFKNLPTKAYTTPSESDEWNFSNTKSNCAAINNAGGNCTFYSMAGYDHGSVNDGVYKKELFEWMIKQ